jgi:ribosomal protein L18E
MRQDVVLVVGWVAGASWMEKPVVVQALPAIQEVAQEVPKVEEEL